ncbi:hypothetical protein LMG18090_00239 [Ralstonia mannitolilytica]|uniref:hypothetical protein n=1 Tax=Ralstonia mannitolilytica TaxID=105219 RepID=UPI0028F582DA|nr:hypothetical protein [Ralstonia mannitolilytica]CAJ0773907.1 hypothetical protein LMG18090_00239 [Ralstonia mannitolilytica]
MFRKLVANDEAVRTIFDHFRNISIAGAVFAAGVWSLKDSAPGLLGYLDVASGVALCALGVFLLVLAVWHANRKFEEVHLPVLWKWTVNVVYGLSLLTLFATAAFKI